MSVQELKSLKSHDLQRTLKPKNVISYTESMLEHGFWDTHPIVWYRENGKKTIVWGHHRRDAAIAANCEAWTVEMTDVTYEDTIKLITDENWHTWDIHETVIRECKVGNLNYLILKSYIDRGLSLGVAVTALEGSGAYQLNKAGAMVKRGLFVVRTEKYARQLLHVISELKGLSSISNSHFLRAILCCMFVKEFNVDTFIARAIQYPYEIKVGGGVSYQRQLIEEIYNYQNRSKIPLSFLAEQAARTRRHNKAA